MKLFLLKIKSWSLKRKARKLYYAIEAETDLGCGISLAEYIRPQIAIKRQALQVLINRAKDVDAQIEMLTYH